MANHFKGSGAYNDFGESKLGQYIESMTIHLSFFDVVVGIVQWSCQTEITNFNNIVVTQQNISSS